MSTLIQYFNDRLWRGEGVLPYSMKQPICDNFNYIIIQYPLSKLYIYRKAFVMCFSFCKNKQYCTYVERFPQSQIGEKYIFL